MIPPSPFPLAASIGRAGFGLAYVALATAAHPGLEGPPSVRWFVDGQITEPAAQAFALGRLPDGDAARHPLLPLCHLLSISDTGALGGTNTTFWETANFSALRHAGKRVIVAVGGPATACPYDASGRGDGCPMGKPCSARDGAGNVWG